MLTNTEIWVAVEFYVRCKGLTAGIVNMQTVVSNCRQNVDNQQDK